MDSVPHDGAVDEERLRLLLGLQTELPALDYKQRYDLATAGKSKFDFVKDCAAMLSRPHGGYLVVGVDDRGQPVAPGLHAADFDSSRLRDILAKHLEGSIDVRSAVHDINDVPVALIYLARRADGLFPIIKSDFTYTEPGGAQKTALRAGDVFVRDGTSTRRWRSADLPTLLAPYVETARREERARIDDIVAAVRQQYRGLEAAVGPAAALTWQLGQDDFDTAIIELSRRRDQVPIRLLGFDIARDGCALLDDPGTDASGRLQDLLDRAVSALAYGIVLDDEDLVERLTRALYKIYIHGLVLDQPRNDVDATVQFTIVARVLAAIALAVRIGAWWAVRPLTLQPVGTEPDAYERTSWLRHAMVWNSRWNTAPTSADGHPIPGVLIAQAREIITRVPALRRDVAAPVGAFAVGETPQRDDSLLDSLCQADLLWCLVAFLHGGKDGTRDFYTSFAALYEHRVQPMVHRLLTDDLVVTAVFPDSTPENLREAIAVVLRMASSEGARFGHINFGLRNLA
ncbi:ATP-binding protein [Micromonospora sp. NPDC049257]|uniref:AlbA family DNA-binding domain-containing protein n=1 Tax=Micromonospora sp. NPDC049257 TaxID=3155771 RepID=UPI003424B2C6